MVPRNESIKEDDIDENAFDSPFSLQEEDLENDDPSLAELERELEEDLAKLERALGNDELLEAFDSPEND